MPIWANAGLGVFSLVNTGETSSVRFTRFVFPDGSGDFRVENTPAELVPGVDAPFGVSVALRNIGVVEETLAITAHAADGHDPPRTPPTRMDVSLTLEIVE